MFWIKASGKVTVSSLTVKVLRLIPKAATARCFCSFRILFFCFLCYGPDEVRPWTTVPQKSDGITSQPPRRSCFIVVVTEPGKKWIRFSAVRNSPIRNQNPKEKRKKGENNGKENETHKPKHWRSEENYCCVLSAVSTSRFLLFSPLLPIAPPWSLHLAVIPFFLLPFFGCCFLLGAFFFFGPLYPSSIAFPPFLFARNHTYSTTTHISGLYV